jgi:hypothetical protein
MLSNVNCDFRRRIGLQRLCRVNVICAASPFTLGTGQQYVAVEHMNMIPSQLISGMEIAQTPNMIPLMRPNDTYYVMK